METKTHLSSPIEFEPGFVDEHDPMTIFSNSIHLPGASQASESVVEGRACKSRFVKLWVHVTCVGGAKKYKPTALGKPLCLIPR